MYTKTRYSLKDMMLWTREDALVFLAISAVPVILYELMGLKWLHLPWLPDAPHFSMLIWCALFGFGGSILSLALSKTIARRSTRARVIEAPSNDVEQWLVRTVERQAKEAGIGMPEVAVFDSPDPNAFATGMFRNSALVAVSTGLLQLMSKEEAEAVLGHEVSHVANGDAPSARRANRPASRERLSRRQPQGVQRRGSMPRRRSPR
jgi:heat shock protein HtpX